MPKHTYKSTFCFKEISAKIHKKLMCNSRGIPVLFELGGKRENWQ